MEDWQIHRCTNFNWSPMKNGSRVAYGPIGIINRCLVSRENKLDLHSRGIKVIPCAINDCNHLTVLDMSNNAITNLSNGLCRLAGLVNLDLCGNNISKIPEAIVCLTNLTTLNLASNKLATLPVGLWGMASLTRLNVSGNQLTELPDAVSFLENLEELDLAGNKLTRVPPKMMSMVNLKKLNLQKNPLVEPPISLHNIPDLEIQFPESEKKSITYYGLRAFKTTCGECDLSKQAILEMGTASLEAWWPEKNSYIEKVVGLSNRNELRAYIVWIRYLGRHLEAGDLQGTDEEAHQAVEQSLLERTASAVCGNKSARSAIWGAEQPEAKRKRFA